MSKASTPLQAGWQKLHYATLYKFRTEGYTEVGKRFKSLPGCGLVTFSYHASDDVFEIQCMIEDSEKMVASLVEVISNYVKEDEDLAKMNDRESNVVRIPQSRIEEDLLAVLDLDLADVLSDGSLNADDCADPESPHELYWTPEDNNINIDLFSSSRMLRELEAATRCKLELDVAARRVKIISTDDEHVAGVFERLGMLEKDLIRQPPIAHVLHTQKQQNFRLRYETLKSASDGTLGRLLLPEHSPLKKESCKSWEAQILDAYMCRYFRYDEAARQYLSPARIIEPSDTTRSNALNIWENFQFRDIGNEAPAMSVPVEVIPKPESPPVATMSQDIERWVYSVEPGDPKDATASQQTEPSPLQITTESSVGSSLQPPLPIKTKTSTVTQITKAKPAATSVISRYEDTPPNDEPWNKENSNGWQQQTYTAEWGGEGRSMATIQVAGENETQRSYPVLATGPSPVAQARGGSIQAYGSLSRRPSPPKGRHNNIEQHTLPRPDPGRRRRRGRGSRSSPYRGSNSGQQATQRPASSGPALHFTNQQPVTSSRIATMVPNLSANRFALMDMSGPGEEESSESTTAPPDYDNLASVVSHIPKSTEDLIDLEDRDEPAAAPEERHQGNAPVVDREEPEEESELFNRVLIRTSRQRKPSPNVKSVKGKRKGKAQGQAAANHLKQLYEDELEVRRPQPSVKASSGSSFDGASRDGTWETSKAGGASPAPGRSPGHNSIPSKLTRTVMLALDCARSFRGLISMEMQIGQILLQDLPSALTRDWTEGRDLPGKLVDFGGTGFRDMWGAFTNVVTTAGADTHSVLTMLGMNQQEVYKQEAFWEIICKEPSSEEVRIYIDAMGDMAPFAVTGEQVLGAVYYHVPQRVWNSRFLVKGTTIHIELSEITGAQDLAQSLYSRSNVDGKIPELQGRDGLLQVMGVRLRSSLHYTTPTSFAGKNCLHLTRIQDMVINRPTSHDPRDSGIFRAAGENEKAMLANQGLWFEISLGQLNPPPVLETNLTLELGKQTDWDVADLVDAVDLEGLEALTMKLVEKMDAVGAGNKGPAYEIERKITSRAKKGKTLAHEYW